MLCCEPVAAFLTQLQSFQQLLFWMGTCVPDTHILTEICFHRAHVRYCSGFAVFVYEQHLSVLFVKGLKSGPACATGKHK